jgi:hypothetical protein
MSDRYGLPVYNQLVSQGGSEDWVRQSLATSEKNEKKEARHLIRSSGTCGGRGIKKSLITRSIPYSGNCKIGSVLKSNIKNGSFFNFTKSFCFFKWSSFEIR